MGWRSNLQQLCGSFVSLQNQSTITFLADKYIDRGKLNKIYLSYNNVFFKVLLLILSRNCIHHIVWADRKSASVIHVNRKLWDINPFRSRCFFSLAFIVTHHHSLYRCFNGFFECILLFWKSRFHLRQRGRDENLFLSTSMFVTIFENMVLFANRWPLKVGSPIEGECVGHKLKELKTENWKLKFSYMHA